MGEVRQRRTALGVLVVVAHVRLLHHLRRDSAQLLPGLHRRRLHSRRALERRRDLLVAERARDRQRRLLLLLHSRHSTTGPLRALKHFQ